MQELGREGVDKREETGGKKMAEEEADRKGNFSNYSSAVFAFNTLRT